jgi:PASTA domain-containing protein
MHLTTRAAALAACTAVATAIAACGGGSGGTDQPAPPKAAPAAPAAPGTVVVPQLVGVEQGTAHRLVRRAGLDMRAIGYVGKYGNGRYNVSCVKIISQSPIAGERRKKGAVISVIEKECETPRANPVPPAGTATPGQPSPGGSTSSTSV